MGEVFTLNRLFWCLVYNSIAIGVFSSWLFIRVNFLDGSANIRPIGYSMAEAGTDSRMGYGDPREQQAIRDEISKKYKR